MAKVVRKHPNIIEAPFHRRLGAFLIDLIVIAVIGLLAYMSIDAVFYQTKAGQRAADDLFNVRSNSGLYLTNSESKTVHLRDEDITKNSNEQYYLASLAYFYNEAVNPFDQSQLFTYKNSAYFDENLDFNFYVMVLNKDKLNTLFTFVEEEGEVTSFAFKPLVSAADKNAEWSRIYNIAIRDLETSTAYLKARIPHTNILFYGGGIALLIGAIAPSLVIPLLFKNGQSLGKYVTGLALVNKDGYKVKSSQVVIRFLVLGVFELGASLRLYVIPLFITSAAVTVSRGGKALHDIIASTYVVDARSSQIFNNFQEEERFFSEATSKSDKEKIVFYQMPAKTMKTSKTRT